MADENSTEPQDNPDATEGAEQNADGLGDPGKKALAEERRQRRAAERAHAEVMARLKEIEDRDKTEAQKLAERAEAAEKQIADLQRQAQVTAAARAAGLEAKHEKFLTGTTPEELQEQAAELAAMRAAAEQPRVPAPFAGQGSSEGGPKMSPADFMNHQLRVATGRASA